MSIFFLVIEWWDGEFFLRKTKQNSFIEALCNCSDTIFAAAHARREPYNRFLAFISKDTVKWPIHHFLFKFQDSEGVSIPQPVSPVHRYIVREVLAACLNQKTYTWRLGKVMMVVVVVGVCVCSCIVKSELSIRKIIFGLSENLVLLHTRSKKKSIRFAWWHQWVFLFRPRTAKQF